MKNNFTENAMKVLNKRYLKKDDNGIPIEDVSDLFKRVAEVIASAEETNSEEWAEKFYELMINKQFMPNSPTLMNAGRELGQLSACFVLPIEDSMEGIYEGLKNAALIHKSGGGTGFSFSKLRQKGSTVKTTKGVSSGPISFMKVYNASTEAVKQGGTRRGANMGVLRVDHPDILDFINCKENNADLTNFNISVAITKEFMNAVTKGIAYNLYDPRNNEITGQLDAQQVFNKIVECAWQNGEPGVIFIDEINAHNPVPQLGVIESTNPCGEQPLLPFESCNLGSINLSEIFNAVKLKSTAKINMKDILKELAETVKIAVRFLDDVITVNKYPIDIIKERTLETRKIGLGVMGFADFLFKIKTPYNSPDALKIANAVMKCIQDTAKQTSKELGLEKGNFPAWDNSIYADMADMPQRNATVTTIAPTGTISIICDASSGIEPQFALVYKRNVMDNDVLLEVNPYFEQVIKSAGLYTKELMQEIEKTGSIQNIEEIPEEIRKVFVTAHDITPTDHLQMQAVFQKYTDNAVSKTINLKKDATVEDVKDIYMYAYKNGIKGVTIYRDGSRESQVLSIGNSEKKTENMPKCRPDVLSGLTEKVKIGCGNLYVTVNYDENGICEVFTNLGRAGGCPAQSEATSRLTSIMLRTGINPGYIIEQLKGIRCHSTLKKDNVKVLSCPDAIAKILTKVMAITNVASEVDFELTDSTNNVCPECNTHLEFDGGCVVCRNCGYSKCG